MKLRFNRQEMAEALSAICSVAAARTPKEILKCVRMEAQSDVLLLAATDLELSLRCAVTQVEVDKPGKVVVVADTLSRIVRECADDTLAFETDASQLHVRGASSHFRIMSQDVAEFPPVPTNETEPDYTIEQGALRRLIEWTVLSAARESTRYAINGVLWEINDGKLTLAATDGRRLSRGEAALTSGGKGDVPSAIVPLKTLNVFSRLDGDEDAPVSVKVTSNQILLSVGGALLGSALVEGHFPNYRDVIPSDCDLTATLNSSEFHSGLKQAALLTNEESKGVRLAFADDSLTISSRAPEQGDATVTISAKYKHDPIEIGFNPVFLLDVLRAVHDDQITFSMKEPNRPGLLRSGKDFLYVVMPVNLTSA